MCGEPSVWDGIVIGGAGGAVAGLTVLAVQYFHEKWKERADSTRIYEWLKANTRNEPGHRFRSTRTIASWTNLTQDRVQLICSIHEKIYLSVGDKEDMWGLYEHEERSVYETRGLLKL